MITGGYTQNPCFGHSECYGDLTSSTRLPRFPCSCPPTSLHITGPHKCRFCGHQSKNERTFRRSRAYPMLMEVSTLMLRPQFPTRWHCFDDFLHIASSFTKRRCVEGSFATIGEIL